MNTYFGEPWDAPAIDGNTQAPTPVGVPCLWCGVPVKDGDQGFLIGCIRLDKRQQPCGTVEPYHRECLMRSTVGSPAHLDGNCICHGATGDANPQTPEQKRAEALEVWDRITNGRFGAEP